MPFKEREYGMMAEGRKIGSNNRKQETERPTRLFLPDSGLGKGKALLTLVLALVLAVFLLACEGAGTGEDAQPATEISASLVYDSSLELSYATMFTVDYYEGGYALITINGEDDYLVVPEDGEIPEDLPEGMIVLQQPLTNLYLAASAVMDMFVSLDALDTLRFSSLDVDGWYIDEAVAQMESGALIYAGKYSAPDYELILSEGCSLAIENTMIYHSPEIKEELEQLGIPVLVDYSSYESNPLGRMEWIKLYGVLTGQEIRAEESFAQQEALYLAEDSAEDTGLTVAFFYFTTSGAVNVRKSSDYLAAMIAQAGGVYIFSDLGSDTDTASSTMSMQMEEFYAAAKEADYLIYNSTIEGELSNLSDFLALNPLLEKFTAVEEGHVYCTSKNLYQASMQLGTITADMRSMLKGETDGLTYLYHLE